MSIVSSKSALWHFFIKASVLFTILCKIRPVTYTVLDPHGGTYHEYDGILACQSSNSVFLHAAMLVANSAVGGQLAGERNIDLWCVPLLGSQLHVCQVNMSVFNKILIIFQAPLFFIISPQSPLWLTYRRIYHIYHTDPNNWVYSVYYSIWTL